jgi:hypothetical protein
MSHKHAAGANTAKRRRSRIWKVLPILGLVGCCFTWVWVGVILDDNEERMYGIIVDDEIPFDPTSLPARPTEADYYKLAVQALRRYQWGGSARLTLVGIRIPCAEFDPVVDEVHLHFSGRDTLRDGTVLGLLPRVMKAALSVHVSEASMKLSVIDGGIGVGPFDSGINLKQVTVSAEEALQIAEKQGGRSYRRHVLNRCNVNLDLTDNSWIVVYRGPEGDAIRVRIDATTGKVY